MNYNNNNTGKFIVFEGIDGSGKSTISKMFHKHLEDSGIPSVLTMEPTTGYWGNIIRSSLNRGPDDTESFFIDRNEHVHNVILPSIKSGITVVCDRYYHSSAVYQGIMMGDPHFIISRNEKVFPKPDYVVIIDTPASIAWGRINGRGKTDNFESGGIVMLEKYRATYLSLFSLRPNTIIVDGNLSPNEILNSVINLINLEKCQ